MPLTAILAGMYSSSITLFQKAFVATTGEQSDAAIVLTTLILVSFFTPLKDSLEKTVERHFKEPDNPTQHLSAFGERISAVLLVLDSMEIARHGLQEAVAAFGAKGGALRLRQGEEQRLPEAPEQWTGETAVSVPLIFAGKELGLLALGQRRGGQVYSDNDVDTLHHCADIFGPRHSRGQAS